MNWWTDFWLPLWKSSPELAFWLAIAVAWLYVWLLLSIHSFFERIADPNE